MKPFPLFLRTSRHGSLVACVCAFLFLAAAASEVLAQKKTGVRRPRDSKEELMERARQLKDELPGLKDAAMSEDEQTREDVRRRALQILDDAVSTDMKTQLEAESKRLSDGKQSSAAEKLETARKLAEKARAEVPDDARKLLDGVPKALLDADAGDSPEDGEQDLGDGMLVKTSDGSTIRVPGVQVAGQFDGQVIPVEGNGPAPGPKPAPKTKRLTKAQKAAEAGLVEIECEGSAVFSSNGENPEAGGAGPRVIIFNDRVRITSADTVIVCDKLIVYMKPEPEADPKKDDGQEGLGGGTIDRAVATGSEVVVQQTAQKKEGVKTVRLAKARKATYYNNGDVVLEDFPQVQEDENFTIATARSTVITLPGDRSKKAVANGPNTTRIMLPSEEGDSALFKGQN